VPVGSFTFDNPLFSDAPPLAPDPVGTTKTAGDLSVTLKGFATGIGNHTTHRWNGETKRSEKVYSAADPNDRPEALIHVQFDSPRGTNQTWFIYDADLSDGSGNHVDATSRSGMSDHMAFSPVLWPGEPAWNVRLHAKRKTGFLPDELITFSNIAIPLVNTTNQIRQTNHAAGIQVVFDRFFVRPPLKDPNSWSSSELSQFRIEHDELDDTNQIDLVSITVHPMGTNVTTSGSSWSDSYHEYNLRSIPTNATHMDFTFSVQKARFVDFNVTPNWITNDYVVTEE